MLPPGKILRAVLSNFGWLSVGRMLGDAAMFAFLVVLSRWHGESGLGEYTFALAVTLIYSVVADCGIYQMFLREQAHRGDNINEYFGKIMSLGLVLTSLALLALVVTIMLVPLSHDSKIILLLVGASQLFNRTAEGCSYVFLATQKTWISGCLEVASKSLAALIGSALIVLGLSLPVALAALPCVALGRAGAVHVLIATRIGWPSLVFRVAELLAVLRAAGKYAASVLQMPIHARADVITLGLVLDAAAVGIYNAAFRLVMLLNVAANLASVALFPLISKLYATSKDEVGPAYHATLRASLLITLPAAAGLWLIAPKLIIPIFGPDFVESVIVLRFLCWLIVVFTLRAVLAGFLAASGLQATRAKIEWLGTAATVVGCLLLVTTAGVAGAALAVLLAEGVMVAMMMARLSILWGWPDVGQRVLVSACGIAGFGLPVLLWPSMSIALVIPGSIVIYVGVLALSKDIRNTEYRLLRAALRGRRRAADPPTEQAT